MDGFRWDYSGYSDIFHIHKKDKITSGSVEVGDFSLDFGKNNEIVGVEIEHASEFFINSDISKESLSDIKDAGMVIDTRNPSCSLIFLNLRFSNISRKIALPMPIVA